MKLIIILFALFSFSFSIDTNSLVAFADKNWDCADVNCDSTVNAGDGQPNYQCAEFVARSLVAGGAISGLGAYDSQSSYQYYQWTDGNTYNLLWVSSQQGGSLGLEDLLQAMGWSNTGRDCSIILPGYVIISTGADGPHSHTFVGVGSELIDAHNNARYHVNSCHMGTINAIYQPPSK